MDIYSRFSYDASRKLTKAYSTSFGLSSLLFSKSIRRHIYAIYGLVRLADEIVDTYRGADQATLLDEFEAQTYIAMSASYSTNPIIHSFVLTAKQFAIPKKLLTAFFKSMRMDLDRRTYNESLYKTYIYGSAEVIGLMCLHVFCNGDMSTYAHLEKGASALGAAYQKINFLRDFASDYHDLGRIYFPKVTFESFNEGIKKRILKDIHADIRHAMKSLNLLPRSSRVAVSTSLAYYSKLLYKLEKTPADVIKRKRTRINNIQKFFLLGGTALREGIKK
jgi:phytoene/squalene synthetase